MLLYKISGNKSTNIRNERQEQIKLWQTMYTRIFLKKHNFVWCSSLERKTQTHIGKKNEEDTNSFKC